MTDRLTFKDYDAFKTAKAAIVKIGGRGDDWQGPLLSQTGRGDIMHSASIDADGVSVHAISDADSLPHLSLVRNGCKNTGFTVSRDDESVTIVRSDGERAVVYHD